MPQKQQFLLLFLGPSWALEPGPGSSGTQGTGQNWQAYDHGSWTPNFYGSYTGPASSFQDNENFEQTYQPQGKRNSNSTDSRLFQFSPQKQAKNISNVQMIFGLKIHSCDFP